MTEQNVQSGLKRAIWPAVQKGLRRKCPRCGIGKIFSGYLSVNDECAECGQEFHHHRADDLHPWITILVTGHLIAPLMLYGTMNWAFPDWVHMALWPGLTALIALLILPFAKGFVITLQWALRMHGFASGD